MCMQCLILCDRNGFIFNVIYVHDIYYILAALKFCCKTCVAMKFVDDDDDYRRKCPKIGPSFLHLLKLQGDIICVKGSMVKIGKVIAAGRQKSCIM